MISCLLGVFDPLAFVENDNTEEKETDMLWNRKSTSHFSTTPAYFFFNLMPFLNHLQKYFFQLKKKKEIQPTTSSLGYAHEWATVCIRNKHLDQFMGIQWSPLVSFPNTLIYKRHRQIPACKRPHY